MGRRQAQKRDSGEFTTSLQDIRATDWWNVRSNCCPMHAPTSAKFRCRRGRERLHSQRFSRHGSRGGWDGIVRGMPPKGHEPPQPTTPQPTKGQFLVLFQRLAWLVNQRFTVFSRVDATPGYRAVPLTGQREGLTVQRGSLHIGEWGCV